MSIAHEKHAIVEPTRLDFVSPIQCSDCGQGPDSGVNWVNWSRWVSLATVKLVVAFHPRSLFAPAAHGGVTVRSPVLKNLGYPEDEPTMAS